MNLSEEKLLIIAPHPDDEVLGCGGLISKMKAAGGKVFVLFMTLGDTPEFSENGNSSFEERKNEIDTVAKFLQIDGWDIAFPGNKYHLRLDTVPQKDLIAKIENDTKVAINTISPTILTTTQQADYNQDHRATLLAALAATRPAPNIHRYIPRLILGYEFCATVNWGPEPFLQRNLYISLSSTDVEKKTKAMQLYASQVHDGAHTRAPDQITHLARIRGASCGEMYAESYHIYRMIQ